MRHVFFGFTALAAFSCLAYFFAAAESPKNSITPTDRAPLPVAHRVFEYTRSGDLGEQHIVVEKEGKKNKNQASRAAARSNSQAQRFGFSHEHDASSFDQGTLGRDNNQASQLAALGIKPREGSLPSKFGKERGFSRRLSKARIQAKRWDREVSGPNAHPAMFSHKSDGQCSVSNTKLCETRAVRDATFTGVVVETERLTEEPSHPLEGQVKAGHYVEATPAVYVK